LELIFFVLDTAAAVAAANPLRPTPTGTKEENKKLESNKTVRKKVN
jgi:hypothetical protein